MYTAFENMRALAKTRTNVRVFLDDPNKKDGNFSNYLSFILEGTMEVFTSAQAYTTWGDTGPLYVLPWYIGDMPSEGDSEVGIVKMNGNPGLLSTGVIRQNVSGQQQPSTLEASVFQSLTIPGHGVLHNKFPVIVKGVADSIPPFHTEAACACALLFDEADVPRGMIGGRSLTILGPA